MEPRPVVRGTDGAHAPGQEAEIGFQLLAAPADMLVDDGERRMRQQRRPLQDHAIELQDIVLGAHGEDRHRLGTDVGAVGVRDHLGHRDMARQRLGLEQGLADAVAQGRVQAAATEQFGVDGAGVEAEVHGRAAEQPRPKFFPQEFEMFVGVEHRIAAGDAGEDHVGAIADGHLTIVEDQHHRHDRARLHDRRHAGLHGGAAIDEAVGFRAGLDGQHVLVEEARRAGCEDDVGYSASAGAHDERGRCGRRAAPSSPSPSRP